MIHLVKTKTGKFQAVVTGKNGELTVSSEPLTSKANVWKNIYATAAAFKGDGFLVQDESMKNKHLYTVHDGKKTLVIVPIFHPQYIAGKNKKSTPKKK